MRLLGINTQQTITTTNHFTFPISFTRYISYYHNPTTLLHSSNTTQSIMLNTLSSAALLGAVAVSANPLAYGPLNGWGGSPSNTWGSGASSTVSSYGASQTPFTFPLSNGFPNVSDATLRGIEVTAQGTLPNGPPVTHLNTTSITIFGKTQRYRARSSCSC